MVHRREEEKPLRAGRDGMLTERVSGRCYGLTAFVLAECLDAETAAVHHREVEKKNVHQQ